MQRLYAAVALLAGVLGAPPARAGDVYTYTDADGVIHFTNAPTDSRFRRVKARGGQSLYRGDGQVRETRIPRTDSLERWRETIRQAAVRYGLPEALLLAVMAVESNFDHQAVSEKGAMGLM